MSRHKYAVFMLLIFIIGAVVIMPFISKGLTRANSDQISNLGFSDREATVLKDSVLGQNYPTIESRENNSNEINKPKTLKVLVTAYSSSPDETDDTPFITASGSHVRYGVVAANFLPFETRIRLPKVFGDQVFIVEDRLHHSLNDRVDIWLSSKEEALEFGFYITEMEIL